MAKCYKLRYVNKTMLFFEFQKGGSFDPRTPPPLGAPLLLTTCGMGTPLVLLTTVWWAVLKK